MDHLDGILYTSKVSQLIVDKAKEKVKKNLKRIEKDRKLHAAVLKQQKNDSNVIEPTTTASVLTVQEKPTVFEYGT